MRLPLGGNAFRGAPDGAADGSPEESARWRLGAWLALIGLLAAVGYAARATGGKPDRDVLYKSSTAIGAIVQEAVVLAIVLGIGRAAALRSLRHPRSWPRALVLAVVAFIAIAGTSAALEPLLHAGSEQGLTPDRWDPSRSAAYTFNFIVIAALVPIVEELIFRGVGFSLLRRFGAPVAIGGTAVAFALAHGLVQGFPVLLVFGLGLGWLRWKTGSIIPGIAVHASFNALSLILAVTT